MRNFRSHLAQAHTEEIKVRVIQEQCMKKEERSQKYCEFCENKDLVIGKLKEHQ